MKELLQQYKEITALYLSMIFGISIALIRILATKHCLFVKLFSYRHMKSFNHFIFKPYQIGETSLLLQTQLTTARARNEFLQQFKEITALNASMTFGNITALTPINAR
jgi:hypothetical protein